VFVVVRVRLCLVITFSFFTTQHIRITRNMFTCDTFTLIFCKIPVIFCCDFVGHFLVFCNEKYTDHKTINSNNYAKFEVNWPRGSQFTARHTKNRLQFDE
jgi:hypothetical protein